MTLVSVIVPTHNRSSLLSRAINSVLKQSHRVLECIIVDDASSDNSAEIVANFDDTRLVYLRHETSRGASAARNTGIAHSKAEMIAFLDDDDEWLPEKLEKQVPILENAAPSVGMVYCWMNYYDHGKLIKEHHPTYRGYVLPYILDRQRIGGCPTLLVRRSVVETVGGFDEKLPRGNDGDFIRRVCREYHVDVVPKVLVNVYIGHGERITVRNRVEDVDQGIFNKKRRLEMFGDEFQKYPRALSRLYSRITHDYLCRYDLSRERKDLKVAWRYLIRSMASYPLNLSAFRNFAVFFIHQVRKGR